MVLKTILLVVYTFITVILFATFEASLAVWVSFFISALVLFLITIHHLFVEKQFSPFISCFIVFSYLFFFVAPIIQINTFTGRSPAFMQNLPYNPEVAVQTNFFIIFFNVIFFLSYIGFKKSRRLTLVPVQKAYSFKLRPLTIAILASLTFIVVIVSFPFLQDELRRPSWQQSEYSTGMLLVYKKVLFLIPFAGIILCVQYLKIYKKNTVNYLTITVLLLFFILALLWFKNPLTEKRNALGPIYICLIYLFLPRLLYSNVKTLFFMFFSMVILFPLTAILTHSNRTLTEIINNPEILLEEMSGGGISNAFNTLNYDAFANIMATIDYVGLHGFAYGEQLLSAFLFFVPRSLWEGKPYGTGQLVGEHLIQEFDFNYSNLSNPYLSEGYINFSVLGIIMAAIAMAYVCTRFVAWLKGEDILKKIMAFYFAIHLIFLLRGDFTSGFSYYVGTLVGVVVIPHFITYLIHQFLSHNRTWKNSEVA